jgi:tetratricopeptide (TPR) repeat protein
MRYDDDYEDDDLPPRHKPQGVPAGWRVAAVVSFVLLGVCALLLFSACIALATRPRPAPPPLDPQPQFVFPQPQLPPPDPPAVAQNNDEDANADPRTLPYPLVQDLRPPGAAPVVPGEPPAKHEPDAREQFVGAGQLVWTSAEPSGPQVLLVSPDGANIAYAGSRGVMAGPPQDLQLIIGSEPAGAFALGGLPGPGLGAGAGPSVSAWSSNGTDLYWARADDFLSTAAVHRRLGAPPVTPIHGVTARCAVPVPPDDRRLVLVRDRARPKVEAPLRQWPADPSEVVVYEAEKKVARILIPVGTAVWRAPAVSPDGKRLALVSDSGHEAELPRLWRVFVIDLAGGEPKPLTPASSHAGTVCWGPEGKTLIYARSAAPNEENFLGDAFRPNVFEVDPATRREAPLTVGGGFSSPSVTRDGQLYCLDQARVGVAEHVQLFRLPLAKARELAAKQNPDHRGTKVWTEMAAAALTKAGVPADARAPALDEEKVKKLAAAFGEVYRERFKADLPDTAAELDRLRGAARGLSLPVPQRRQIGLVLGAVEGEYLRRKHGARWALGKPAGAPLADPKVHELFRHIVNPFHDFWAQDADDFDPDEESAFGTLVTALSVAEGRPLVLAHDQAVRTHVAAADADLARGAALLKEGQGDEADRVLLELTKRHTRNYHLALHVGALLSDQGRKDALRTLAGRLNADALKEARVYNLVGVSRLDDNPQAAIAAFKNALRCNLYHGPAYFNLAQACEKANNVAAARRCLRRYLKLMPYGPLAEDARRRLAALPPDAAQ